MDYIKKLNLDLVKKLQDLSENADVLSYNNNNIIRMKKRSISELAEDELANFLFKALDNKNIEIFINPNIVGIRPDIMIVRGNEIIALIELKIDFGWCRNIFDPLKENGENYYNNKSQIHNRLYFFKNNLSNKVIFKDTKYKINRELYFNKNCKLYYIVATTGNYISKRNVINDFEDFLKQDHVFNYNDYLKFGIIVNEYHRNKFGLPTEEELLLNIGELYKTNYSLYNIVNDIKNTK